MDKSRQEPKATIQRHCTKVGHFQPIKKLLLKIPSIFFSKYFVKRRKDGASSYTLGEVEKMPTIPEEVVNDNSKLANEIMKQELLKIRGLLDEVINLF